MNGAVAKTRFLALDVFRGLTVCLMILVNTPGPGARPFDFLVHARWIGFTAADVVFPSFLFAVGCSMAFAFARRPSIGAFVSKVLRRTGLIFLLGFLMYWYPFVHETHGSWSLIPFAETRVTGVLQRIALCYLVAAFAVRWLSPARLVVFCAVLLAAYWAALLAFGAPGAPFSKFGNAGFRLDLALLGAHHLYQRDGGFDPEGVLGTMPATVNVVAGYLAALWLKTGKDLRPVLGRMAILGAVLVAAGVALSPPFPIAKKLWTDSFVLVTVGLDLVLLAALAAAIEGRPPNRVVRFFRVFGVNPLAIYLFSELFVSTLELVRVAPGLGAYGWIGEHVFQALVPGPVGSLMCAIAYTLVCWCFGSLLDRRRLYIRL
jgi:predicted acyltransferase